MLLTNLQKKALRQLAMSKVVDRPMWIPEHMLGYCRRNNRNYEINLADDTGSLDTYTSVLIHEIGHIYYGHMDVNNIKEIKRVKELCKQKGYDFASTMIFYGGPMSFLNIAMDLEINTKLLEQENFDAIYNNLGVNIVSRDAYDIPYDAPCDTFRDYYEYLFKYVKDNPDQMPDVIVMNDIPFNGGSGVDGDDQTGSSQQQSGTGDSEIDDLLKNDEAAQNKDSKEPGKSSNVAQQIEKNNKSNKPRGAGKSGNTSDNITIEGNSAEDIKKFIQDIISEKRLPTYQHDSLKHYNRRTRPSTGILYDSKRRKPATIKHSKKLLICIDISGSMDTVDIRTAISSLQDIFRSIHPDSKVVTCNTQIDAEYPITKLPSYISTGGGTDMSAGIKYATKNGFTDVLIYSDFDTSISEMIQSIGKNMNLYAIAVGKYYENVRDWNEYEKLNKKIMVYKGN